jgi:acetyl-CoA carboxylase beta subunit/acetyl-CoA carboxylase alpha subunit
MATDRPLYAEIADPGSLARFGEEIEAANPSDWPGYLDQLGRARAATGARHAVTTGVATVGGEPCVLVGFEFAFLGGSMGAAEGARITRAFSVAVAEHLPVVCVSASGGSRMQEGTSALLQMQAVAAAVSGARRAGIPHIAVAGDPTTGGVWSSLIADADVLISVPGARVSFSGSRTRPPGLDPESPEYLADRKWAHGFIDVLSPVPGLRAEVAAAVRLLSPRSRGPRSRGPRSRGHRTRGHRTRGDLPYRAPLPAWPDGDDDGGAGEAPPDADAWTHVGGARSLRRARADRWLAGYFGPTMETTVEIRGDRCGGVDAGLRCGFGRHQGATIAYAAQTGGRITPAGCRTAIRLHGLAARLRLPVLTLIDTPGAAAAPADEAAGIGPALAELFVAMASSPVPITSVVIGEGVSGGALALASPSDLWIAQDGYLAVTSPELAVSILKLGVDDIPQVATWLRLTPAELMSRGIVRGIIRPPASVAGQAADPR